MIQVEASRIIERSIDAVWAYLSNLDNMPAWDPGLLEVKWRRPLALGSVVEMHDASPLLRLVSSFIRAPVFEVSEVENGRRIGLRVSADRGRSWLHAVYSLEPVGPTGRCHENSVAPRRTRLEAVGARVAWSGHPRT
jgi:uncharacterized protein YndB with AHSA1/START domain